MYNDIFNIIRLASDEGRVLTKFEITEIFEILKRENDLYFLCNLLEFNKKKDNELASFYLQKHMIELDLDKIIKNPQVNSIYGINLSIVQALLHEFEHAKQLRIVLYGNHKNEDHTDIEKILLDSSYNYLKFDGKRPKDLNNDEIVYLDKLHIKVDNNYLKNLVKKHKSLYRYAPNERLAEIKSYHIINSMIKYNDLDSELKNTFKKKLDSKLIQGYEKGPKDLCFYSPSYNYLSNLKLYKNFSLVKDFEDDYLKGEEFNFFRLLYGVHVDEEYLKEKVRRLKS